MGDPQACARVIATALTARAPQPLPGRTRRAGDPAGRAVHSDVREGPSAANGSRSVTSLSRGRTAGVDPAIFTETIDRGVEQKHGDRARWTAGAVGGSWPTVAREGRGADAAALAARSTSTGDPYLTALGILVGPADLLRGPLGIFVRGVLIGLLTALIALGMALTYRSNRFINFAQADMGTIPVVLIVMLMTAWGWPTSLAVPTGVLAARRRGDRRARHHPPLLQGAAAADHGRPLGLSQLLPRSRSCSRGSGASTSRCSASGSPRRSPRVLDRHGRLRCQRPHRDDRGAARTHRTSRCSCG